MQAIFLDLGPLSGVEEELLRRAFPLAVAGTVAEGAELIIGTCEVRVRCTRCGAETLAQPNRLLCGECGEWRTRLIAGDELILRSIELEAAIPQQAPVWPPEGSAITAAG